MMKNEILLIFCFIASLEKSDCFSDSLPGIWGLRQSARKSAGCNLVDSSHSIPATQYETVHRRIRSYTLTTRPFKPDDSVELYGGDEEEDEAGDDEEDTSMPDKEGSDVKLMATFLANRLGRAYMRSKLQSTSQETNVEKDKEKESESVADEASSVEEFQKTLADVNEAQSNVAPWWKASAVATNDSSATTVDEASTMTGESGIDDITAEDTLDIDVAEVTEGSTTSARTGDTVDAQAASDVEKAKTPIVLPPVDGEDKAPDPSASETEAGEKDSVENENVQRELLARQLADNKSDNKNKGIPSSTIAGTAKESTTENDSESTMQVEAESATTEIPSTLHKKEGDRNIGLKDTFVEAINDQPPDDVDELWSGIPSIPREISLEFGRPLQVVKEGIPPIRS